MDAFHARLLGILAAMALLLTLNALVAVSTNGNPILGCLWSGHGPPIRAVVDKPLLRVKPAQRSVYRCGQASPLLDRKSAR